MTAVGMKKRGLRERAGSLRRTEAEKCIWGVGGDGGDDFDLFYSVGRDIRRKDT